VRDQVPSKRRSSAALAAAVASVALAAPAGAGATAWVIHGHGYGSGVGMSQWGAYGLARHGRPYGSILEHYYAHTHIGHVDARPVRVLLGSGLGTVRFAGARKACGRRVRRGRAYAFVAAGSGVALANASGRRIAACGRDGSASGGPIHVLGKGTYRGRIVAHGRGRIQLVNRLTLQGYAKGVVPNEMPPSWPQPALRAQAVAARTYAITSERHGAFDVYDDARSQVYRGKGSETPATDRAVNASAGTVVTYRGRAVTTYYFSTSGGYTEDVQNGFIGARPKPWLVGVNDPYDFYSPVHSWRVVRSSAAMRSALAGLYSGGLRRIRVLKRGVSPRIVYAKVVGSGGGTRVSGPMLQSRLGLMSTWLAFKRVRGSPAEVRARLGRERPNAAVPGPPPGAGAAPLAPAGR
jgi:stage II sporulation protein D